MNLATKLTLIQLNCPNCHSGYYNQDYYKNMDLPGFDKLLYQTIADYGLGTKTEVYCSDDKCKYYKSLLAVLKVIS